MPRCTINPQEFVAGKLPTVSISATPFYVDGRLQELRDVNDFTRRITCVDDDVWDMLSEKDRSIVVYEFMGERI